MVNSQQDPEHDNNTWAIILGASSGLGLAAARKLATHGMNLCLVYRNRRSELAAIEATFNSIKDTNNINLVHYNMDAIKPENRQKILLDMQEVLSGQNDINNNQSTDSKNGEIKVLVHSIAKGNLKPMVSSSEQELQNDDFRLTIDSMAISLYDWTQGIFKNNMFSKDARIISYTSEGNTKAWENYAAVSAAKVALESITRSIALEYAAHGIKANCIQAGVTDTASLRMIPGHAELKKHSLTRNPSGRLTTPEDVADVTYLLTTDEAKWITGTIIPVNGGEHLR